MAITTSYSELITLFDLTVAKAQKIQLEQAINKATRFAPLFPGSADKASSIARAISKEAFEEFKKQVEKGCPDARSKEWREGVFQGNKYTFLIDLPQTLIKILRQESIQKKE